MFRVEVLDQDKGHTRIRRHMGEELVEGFQTTGRCTDTHDGKGGSCGWNRRNLFLFSKPACFPGLGSCFVLGDAISFFYWQVCSSESWFMLGQQFCYPKTKLSQFINKLFFGLLGTSKN